MKHVINVTFAGIGGQGVLKASDMLAEAAFAMGYDVKKSEVHGMSQRGGSVTSDVRFGKKVNSPMIPPGESDFLVVLNEDQIEVSRHLLKYGGILITPAALNGKNLATPKCLNVALLGALSRYLNIDRTVWQDILIRFLPEKVHEMNFQAFAMGATE